MNYFEFFDLPVRFILDEAALKRQFYANSKKYHPDFYTLAPEAKQAEILELSTLNNQAYQTLADFDKRMKYLLDLKGALAEEGKNKLPQAFLLEMMDINEALMELEFDFEPEAYQSVLSSLEEQQNALDTSAATALANYEDRLEQADLLDTIKNYYLKKRYLLSIKENLNKFASL
ncbi:MAG: iron-sulfur cluster co-chaperone HscB C-terminal domain-containing protein [Saprospiraceae bacterium]